MEWHQVVKLPSATIPCFFRLLFIERKWQGLILGRKRLDRVVSEAKRLRLSADTFECKWMHMMRLHINLPLFLPSSSPYNPYYYLSIFLTPPSNK
uniref:Uncharacterized protein n=1 Tax=Siphoviridae sp. ctvI513 TaxID=2827965 RepID=A0A8S5TJ95_9CAUD|nr:MAG TPA: hypothetical protein [Siphoviridae sp. ctvI513]